MPILLNGQPTEAPDGLSVAELIRQLQWSGRRLAVELNGEILPRSEHATTRLKAGDRVEVVHAIGGG